ncbi:MAG: hypothetical protein DVB33_02305 [Verrucomicrobia bacterium]|nr:MAG: hypothetical protein DVB33_02305 [Verrucomicrobiota bacterium]
MNSSKAIAQRFSELDFHDDTFVSMTVLPAQARSDATGSVIELRLSRHHSEQKRLVQFIGCANLRVGLDLDVLVSNLPPNTSGVESNVDANVMRELIQSQKRDWDVGYGSTRSPLNDKLNAMSELVLFRVQFFGGIVEIIAREFLIENTEIGRNLPNAHQSVGT